MDSSSIVPSSMKGLHLDLDRFDISGPTHMMSKHGAGSSPLLIDWGKEEHRRCVAACLVKGVYVMENDIHKRRVYSSDALAPPWWNTFGFRPLDVIKDDKLIFGIIYEYEAAAGLVHHPSAPRYVVAFRGTMLGHLKTLTEDTRYNVMVMRNTLPESPRAKISRKEVEKLLRRITNNANATRFTTAVHDGNKTHATNCDVWLAGHSLGASVALDVGRVMVAKNGFNLPTFLFNPPQVSLPPAIDKLTSRLEKLKKNMYMTSYIMKAGLGKVVKPFKPHKERMKKLFEKLSHWAPELYVHEEDMICKGYIDYFEQRQQVQERLLIVARSAMMLSYRDMVCHVLGKEKEQPHLLPSARLWKNTSMHGGAHDLQLWWKPDGELNLNATKYSYP
uniref:Fungal lipase-type domain-containing protein n=1 Tax=Leersia perrieri TaxID=77586 RepID=A0A0D9WZS0_9ORYZ